MKDMSAAPQMNFYSAVIDEEDEEVNNGETNFVGAGMGGGVGKTTDHNEIKVELAAKSKD